MYSVHRFLYVVYYIKNNSNLYCLVYCEKKIQFNCVKEKCDVKRNCTCSTCFYLSREELSITTHKKNIFLNRILLNNYPI